LKYVKEHPDEMLATIEDKTDVLVRELQARHHEAVELARRRSKRRERAAPASDIPCEAASYFGLRFS
jgi:hypothetical protein